MSGREYEASRVVELATTGILRYEPVISFSFLAPLSARSTGALLDALEDVRRWQVRRPEFQER